MVSAVIVAAGSSRRMGFDKLFADLRGKPVIAYSIAAFERTREIAEIVLVIRAEKRPAIEALIASEGWTKVKRVVEGGAGGIILSSAGLAGAVPAGGTL